ncbi:pseudouridine-5'-phosphate glycosidase [Coriobacteriia bacterium Es71-Z0120]|uniref:pseudouridine-5'-phosphate glycosidase n=1 Tax=Parvivirga hydrogeniphila TaxID=2939460 RepID=UPI002260D6FF|nr:pseudouridine-5'-phosphate glycosidase [Parvivirga hydrogeniphila]
MQVAPEVLEALEKRLPVVALESTIISHGFPYPANLECALTAERVAREEGAVPATIAIVGGVVRVGLSRSDIERLAAAKDVAKASTRDIGTLVALGRTGATTVAATMAIARRAGIRIFATGGIGGVHRGGQSTMDVSADLEELARTRVAVVCAGAKSVLDIGRTLEYLETRGVPVLGYQTDDFPAFYTRTSGFPVDARLQDPGEAARVLRVRDELDMPGGEVIANPIAPHDEIPPAEVEAAVEAALRDADRQRISGKAVTPFLLARIHEMSGGRSEQANKALVYSNVRLAARIAHAYQMR